jgi:hypothetical protein
MPINSMSNNCIYDQFAPDKKFNQYARPIAQAIRRIVTHFSE